ncbi:pyridoxal phosphate-dependent aminotransferase [Pseudoxanthomonas winnipegensis]|uniref:Aminotransferase class I/II-fold pyridoxal phosphate-dependent enzyme n=1 Tax=Pseudoxanthomonas winnipegensis TaxID=2480810 RepID=A0A4Q8LPV1_9GAMM|nr:pyridoxal phosphate-dependent aminotransferase [Pseudoxanthomonas winnipegensis]RZZ89267.1 aminotransferase class I/II-fold pyridoxal phosphate-dependent enzyme [Pseudoxanthomonas winnipegensis]TAA33288.1 aminotransferase class I/II-fold pyridoxal phosphate-dependent enzyme [Pseudoxanthomonas winnipegensis]TAA44125.1 aminotransferase class I/II-fold pyridoxal phosphate-dependent enzyme [Pseudoxanthomonas winnipegensis]TBV72807.1 aminotransferase class I/II-fold pyridoxal phosphate-dependent 
MKQPLSRRGFLRGSALAAGAGVGAPLLSLSGLALAQNQSRKRLKVDPAASAAAGLAPVYINANENPYGPSPAALKAIDGIAPQGGRYLGDLQTELVGELASQLGLKPENIVPYAGSTPPLQYTVMAFTSPSAALVTADPTFEQAWRVADAIKAPVHKLPLRKDYSHDVQAMCAADASAGMLYICNPNNPTGSLTTRKDIEYALANKPKGSILVLDEAYIHLSPNAVSGVDLVAKGEDVVVLRTFSKLYGMAGIRLGYAAARPDLLAKLTYYGFNSLPVTAAAAGLASLRDPQLVPQRRNANTVLRDEVTTWLTAQGYPCTTSESNCFMVDVKRPAPEFMKAMATYGVFVGRAWAVWPTWSRITVGTPVEMARFKDAFAKVMAGQMGPLDVKTAMLSDERRDGSLTLV